MAHLHKASPTYIRELAKVNDVWSTDLRVYYPRKDFVFSGEYGAYLAELYTNILFHQPQEIRTVVKYLDVLIEKMVKFSDGMIGEILHRRSENTDSPSLKILKYNQIASITHHQALNMLLIEKITGTFANDSFEQLKAPELQGLATAHHYRLVAAHCLRAKLQVPSTKKGMYWYPECADPISAAAVEQTINLYSKALAADALNGLKFESKGTKSSKKDTSLPVAIRMMAEQNPQTVDDILRSPAIDFANVAEVYTKYTLLRTQYAEAYCSGTHKSMLSGLQHNPAIERVLNYIKGNNLTQIHADIIEIEKKVKIMKFIAGDDDVEDNGTIIFEYGMHSLPNRV